MAADDNGNPSNIKVALVAFMFLATVLALFSLWFNGCAVGPSKTVVVNPDGGSGSGTGSATGSGTGSGTGSEACGNDGDKQTLPCDPGQTGLHTQVCTANGWVDLDNSCRGQPQTKPPCDTVTTFDQLSPIIGLNCVSCHPGFDQLATAKVHIDEMIRRIQLPQDDASHMPATRPSLAQKDIDTFKAWVSGGELGAGDCEGHTEPAPSFQDFPSVEQAMFADVNRVTPGDQPNTRYIIAIDQVNLGSADGLAVAKAAAGKAVNSVSTDRTVRPLASVAPGIWRININDLGINAIQWKFVEDHSQLQFESFTATGKAIKNVTKTRLPWMSVADFNDTALRNASVYYTLTKAPLTFNALVAQLGVDYAADLADFKAALIGFNGSTLSPAANRLMSRHQSADGFFWATYDTGAIVSAQQNVFTNPLLVQAGGQANLKFAAGEQLYSLPNGLMGSFLALTNGNRLDQADPAVVHDFTTNPVSPIIKNAISCFRCHSGGLIHATDQVRGAIASSGIGADDTQRALALFKPQGVMDQIFNDDNVRFKAALAQLGIDPQQPDPISKVSDKFLGDLGLEQVAALLILRPEDLKTCINLSPDGKQQAGQLLSGSTISHDQFVQVAKALLRDCRIFQDPLSQ